MRKHRTPEQWQALVRNQLRHDPLSGQYFVFVNRRKTQMKMLYFARTGYPITRINAACSR